MERREETTAMEADSSMSPDSDSDDEMERMMKRMDRMGRALPPDARDKIKDRGMARKLIHRILSRGGIEDLEELMEIEHKIARRERDRDVNWPFLRSLTSLPSLYGNWATSGSGAAGRMPEPITPQSRPIDEQQVLNNAGGYTYPVDDMTRIRRIICLGTAAGTYYVSEKDHMKENSQIVTKMIEEKKGQDIIKELLALKGRTAKQNSLIVILASCARQATDLKAKKEAYKALPDLCGTPSQLFQFIEYYNNMRGEGAGTGWGRAHRIGVMNWYLSYKDKASKLAMQVTKYRQRNGWSHKDVLRLCHIKPTSDRSSPALAVIFKFIARGLDRVKAGLDDDVPEGLQKIVDYLEATEQVKKIPKENIDAFVELIEKYDLMREHLPTEVLNDQQVWRALLKKMPLFAMIRNLGKMSSMGMLSDDSEDSKLVCQKLSNADAVRNAKLHPFNILQSQMTYESGTGNLGNLSWQPNSDVVRALDNAFYMAFKNVEPTNKRFLLAVDVSPSMAHQFIAGTTMSAKQAAAAMAMVTVRTEVNHEIVGFAGNLSRLRISPEDSLPSVLRTMNSTYFDRTDCSQPMLWAMAHNKKFDVFVIYTDNETWSGQIHVTEALRRYRQSSEILDAKVIVVAFTSTGFTIADPSDRYMLDVAGFDSNAPDVMRNFIMGKI